MKKYELIERTAEFKDKRAIKPGCTVDIALNTPGYDKDPEILKSFDSLDEAREALKNYESDVRVLSGHDGKRYYLVTEYMVEENDYDDEGEWCGGGDDWAFSKMPDSEID